MIVHMEVSEILEYIESIKQLASGISYSDAAEDIYKLCEELERKLRGI